MSGDYTLTLAGNKVFPACVTPSQIDIGETLWCLSMMNRYAGATPTPYTVGQHTLAIMSYTPQTGPLMGEDDLRYWLIHDWHEAITGEIVGPVKPLLQPALGDLEDSIDAAIHERLGWVPESRPAYDLDKLMIPSEMTLVRGLDRPEYQDRDPSIDEAVRWAMGLSQNAVHTTLLAWTKVLFPGRVDTHA